MRVRFGPAGWDYKDWNGVVYPTPRLRDFEPLAYLARWFDSVEVNSTFYRPMPGKVAEGWLRRVEKNDDFRFTAKLWKRFTHERDTAWTIELAKGWRKRSAAGLRVRVR